MKITEWDQSLVGKEVKLFKHSGKEFKYKITAVGEKSFLAKDCFGTEYPHGIETSANNYWEIAEEKKLFALAWVKYPKGWQPSNGQYYSLKNAKETIHYIFEVRWPALPNDQGYYEPPED